MLKKLILQQLLKSLDFTPTHGQAALMSELAVFFTSNNRNEIFLIKGYAGTGKTTVVNSMVETLHACGFKTVLLAPTGRAAKILSGYTRQPAFTIHKKIYRQKRGRDGLGDFILDRNLSESTWFIVDEASMIGDSNQEHNPFGSGNLLADLVQYVYSGNNCRLIILGDTAQLPPVGLNISPALDKSKLEYFGPAVNEYMLTDVIRQAQSSGILANATSLREQISSCTTHIPCIKLNGFTDILRISGDEILEEIANCYNSYGIENTIIISRSNKRANKFNEGIRNRILWREEEISRHDILMVVKNNYYWKIPEELPGFIANGDIARIEKIHKFHELYGFRYADITLNLFDYDKDIDARIILDTLGMETPSMPPEIQKQLFSRIMDDFEDDGTNREKILKTREDPYLNALQVKFAYAVTCHKAQGGQWKAVFIDPGVFKEDTLSVEYLRWLYTAFTRATEKLYLMNFPESFFR